VALRIETRDRVAVGTTRQDIIFQSVVTRLHLDGLATILALQDIAQGLSER
jgi:hypothetical protein